ADLADRLDWRSGGKLAEVRPLPEQLHELTAIEVEGCAADPLVSLFELAVRATLLGRPRNLPLEDFSRAVRRTGGPTHVSRQEHLEEIGERPDVGPGPVAHTQELAVLLLNRAAEGTRADLLDHPCLVGQDGSRI